MEKRSVVTPDPRSTRSTSDPTKTSGGRDTQAKCAKCGAQLVQVSLHVFECPTHGAEVHR